MRLLEVAFSKKMSVMDKLHAISDKGGSAYGDLPESRQLCC